MKYFTYKLSVFCVLLLVAVFVFTSCTKTDEQTVTQILNDLDATLTNTNLPNIQLTSIAGDEYSLKNILDGKKGVISVWRSGCHFCQEDMPRLMKLSREFDSENTVTFVHISTDQNSDEALAFKEKLAIQGPVLLDSRGAKIDTTNLKITGTPTTFIVDSNAKIVAKIVGIRHWDNAKVKKQMKSLLRQL